MSKRMDLHILLIIPLLLTSCWNAKELTDLTIVSAVGIDETEEGELLVSLQVANSSEVAIGQEGAGRDATTTLVYTSTGNTLAEAMRNVLETLPRQVYFPHMTLIIINEKFAETKGLDRVIDWFERDSQARTNANVMIAREADAREVLMVQTPIQRISATKLTDQIEVIEKRLGENMVMDVDDVVRDLSSGGKELLLSGVKIQGDNKSAIKKETIQQSVPDALLEINGMGIFKDEKLIGWLEDEEVKGALWVLGQIEGAINNVECDGKKDAIAIETKKANSDIRSKINNGNPVIDVSIGQEGILDEINCSKDITKHKEIQELEKLLEENIKKIVEKVITKAQESETDIFGFGEVLHRQNPKYWKENEKKWPEMFAKLEVNVHVSSYIRRSGMRNNSYQNKTNE
ncbi:Ger(x)C family spore germination protein [Salipaludibacillus daqingensis]|uniref:Ger(x)C family spore germination protein n=1 Tax=Salipaludibacillus daqingensis TaxID=3041001 RepID=UPI0024731EC5|nr:Ger(x)C family spore germination protein [Salipaludibacillus daqingensis]